MVMDPRTYYEKSNLKDNPFKSKPNSAIDPRSSIWVGYEKQKKQLNKFLKRSLADQVGNVNFLMLYGDYGTGKSHALLWAQHRILHEERDDYSAVCYFTPTLRQENGKFSFADAFRNDIIAKSNLIADLQAFHDFMVQCITARKAVGDLGEVTNEQVIERLVPAVEFSNFAKELYNCKGVEGFQALLAVKNDYHAMMVFTRIVNLFVHEMEISDADRRRFKSAAYLFVDELDDLQRASLKEARLVNDLLRHIYDSCPNCFCMVIAISAEISQLDVLFFDYVLRRITRQIELVGLGKDDAVEFVREILATNRRDPEGEVQFFTFADAAVDTIVSQLAEITPAKIVNAMQQVIEEVRLAGHNPEDGPVSSDFLDEHDIVEEVLGEGGVA